jgi:hypothetical protein
MRWCLFSAPNPIRFAKVICGCALASSISIFPLLAAYPQAEPDANDPRIVQLYAGAKAAEQSGDIAGAISKYKSILKLRLALGLRTTTSAHSI